ncbi:MAG: glycosyltransferase family 39 protein [Anaerolineaceae bacterium]|nr:glycosyltransferase family 39 protein [Anaerolineaceae bacterium]
MTKQRWLVVILVVALGLRLAYALGQPTLTVYDTEKGDSGWYLENGYTLVTGQQRGVIPVDVSKLPTAPLYLIFIGVAQAALPADGAIIAIRVLQAVMGAATCYFAYRLAWAAADDERAGLVAAAVLAVHPAFVLESAQILTETLYIFLAMGGLWLYVAAFRMSGRGVALSGMLLGLATLTRAVLLLFPLGLALHLLLTRGWRAGLKQAVVLLAAYMVVVFSWTAYNLVTYHRWVIGAEGMIAFLYIGATEEGWQGPEAVDESLGVTDPETQPPPTQEDYLNAAGDVIGSDLSGYIARRFTRLAGAFLQPHGTTFFSGESLKSLAANWWANDRTVVGLLRLTQAEAFWPKLSMYVFHFAGILGGLVGMWLARRRWQVTLLLIGFLVYTLLIHLVLEALPRYLFPLQAIWWVFAAVTIVHLYTALRRGRRSANSQLV